MAQDKFTIKAQEAIGRAQEIAREQNHAEILPLHILAGLIAEEDGVVRPLLQKLGANESRLLSSVSAAMERLPKGR